MGEYGPIESSCKRIVRVRLLATRLGTLQLFYLGDYARLCPSLYAVDSRYPVVSAKLLFYVLISLDGRQIATIFYVRSLHDL